jgi:hypothetical protein
MLILDMEETNETSNLDRVLRDWWTRLKAWLQRQPLAKDEDKEEIEESDLPASLIL